MSLEKAETIKASADADNEKAYRAALAQAGLTPTEPPGPILRLHHTEAVDEEGRELLVIGRWSEMMGNNPPHSSFARDESGRLWLIERRPNVVATRNIDAKGCWSGYDKGVAPAEFSYGYLLPKGQRLAGHKQIEYPAREVSIDRTDGRCDTGPPRP